MSPSPSMTRAASGSGTSRPTCPAACSSCPAAPPASRSASSIATCPAASIPIRSSPPASAPTFRRCRPPAATMSTRPMPSCGCRCSRDTAFFHRLELTGAARYSDYSTSGSTTTFSAGINWEPIEDLLFRGSWAEGFRAPSIGELFGTPSRFDQEVVDPCSGLTGGVAGQHPHQLHRRRRPGQRQLRAAERAAAGGHRRQPESRSGDVGKLGLRRGLAAELPAAAVDRGQLLQHQGRRRDRGDRRRGAARPLRRRPAMP